MFHYSSTPQSNQDEGGQDDEAKTENPFLIRIVPKIKAYAKRVIFSDDSTSQLMVVFTDGTVRVYNLNEIGEKERMKKNSYVNKAQLKNNAIFQPVEMENFDFNYCIIDDDNENYLAKTNLKLSKGIFHPTINQSGLQLSYMLG